MPECFIVRNNCTSCKTERQHVWCFLPVCGLRNVCLSADWTSRLALRPSCHFVVRVWAKIECTDQDQKHWGQEIIYNSAALPLYFLKNHSEFMDSMLQREMYRVLVWKPEGRNHWGDLGVFVW